MRDRTVTCSVQLLSLSEAFDRAYNKKCFDIVYMEYSVWCQVASLKSVGLDWGHLFCAKEFNEAEKGDVVE